MKTNEKEGMSCLFFFKGHDTIGVVRFVDSPALARSFHLSYWVAEYFQ